MISGFSTNSRTKQLIFLINILSVLSADIRMNRFKIIKYDLGFFFTLIAYCFRSKYRGSKIY